MSGEFDELGAMIISGDPGAARVCQGLVAEGESAGRIVDDGLIPEVLLSARTMQSCLGVLEPHLASGRDALRGTIVIGTVEGDVHDIGKNIVTLMLRGAGFQVVDLGIGVSAPAFLEAVKDNDADLLGMSALLTTTMPRMREVIEALREAGMRETVGVLVGGAPVHEAFAAEIGADGAGANAALAVELAKELAGGRKRRA
jgi:5-methyltetrahydrofolate--homocysteine methyltransferase